MTKKLGKRAMRVEIAKDVLKQLRNGNFIAESTYLRTRRVLDYPDAVSHFSGEEIQNEVLKIETCNVCAIGAAFISGIRLFDGISGEMFDVGNAANSIGAQKFFTKSELKTMEAWFENWEDLRSLRPVLWLKIKRMSRKQRMRIVFQSIVDNGGRVLDKDIEARVKRARLR